MSANSSSPGADSPSLPAERGDMWVSEDALVITVIICRAAAMLFLCERFCVRLLASSYSFAYTYNPYCESKQCWGTE